MWQHKVVQPTGMVRTDFNDWNAGNLEGQSWIPWGQQTCGWSLMRLWLDLPYRPSSMVCGNMEPNEDVAKFFMVYMWRVLSGVHWCTSCRSGPKRGIRKETGPMTPLSQHLRNHHPLDHLEYRDPLDNQDPLDNSDPVNNWESWLLTIAFVFPLSILLPRQIFLLQPNLWLQLALPSLHGIWSTLILFTIFCLTLLLFTCLPWQTL